MEDTLKECIDLYMKNNKGTKVYGKPFYWHFNTGVPGDSRPCTDEEIKTLNSKRRIRRKLEKLKRK